MKRPPPKSNYLTHSLCRSNPLHRNHQFASTSPPPGEGLALAHVLHPVLIVGRSSNRLQLRYSKEISKTRRSKKTKSKMVVLRKGNTERAECSICWCIDRSETERLRSLSEKQAQKFVENSSYIKELEDRVALLALNGFYLVVMVASGKVAPSFAGKGNATS